MENRKIEIYENEIRTGSFLLAKGLERKHENVIGLIRKYQTGFEDLGTLKQKKLKSTGGRPIDEYLLTYDQTVFLISIIRNSSKVVELKQKMIKTTTLAKVMDLIKSFDFEESKLRYVYAAVDETGRVKIGISNDPEKRIKNLNIGNADTLQLVFTREAKDVGYSDEVKLHHKCQAFRIRSEWFNKQAMEVIS